MKIIKLVKEIGRNAHIDWIAILVVSIGIALTLAIGGLYLYNAVVRGDIQGNEATSAVSSAKSSEKTISSVIADFGQREEVSRKARVGYEGEKDPSI